ncbi:Tubulin-specific chaperone A [Toxocara canis]|uniref:Tubulin-specific chaperone A n=2 Tax=Toxocara canis TaxID=6265 RepID=A0A0B2V0L2_TOXCA|nr:Tubulin-specific chaperone A [Toxocara canis]VDM50010.1 unnamed protein product [Toxocara canis]
MVDAQLLKELSIKTGIVKRLVKELAYYKVEVEKETAKLESMKAKPDADEHLVRKQGELLQESRSMIPDTTRRMQQALLELKKMGISEVDDLKLNSQETEKTERGVGKKGVVKNGEEEYGGMGSRIAPLVDGNRAILDGTKEYTAACEQIEAATASAS